MLNNQKIAAFIAGKRKEAGLTQAEVAEKLNVSFQAVSKWENGTLPNVEMLVELAALLQVSVDEILSGREKSNSAVCRRRQGRMDFRRYSCQLPYHAAVSALGIFGYSLRIGLPCKGASGRNSLS